MISSEQTEQIKKQLLDQIGTKFPPDKREAAKQQILSMNEKELFEFLKENNMIKDGETPQIPSEENQCIFCSIASGNVQSYKIDENKDSVAILELNPISKGHSIIIPIKHISASGQIPQTAFSLAKKISKKLKTKFKPKEVIIASSNLFGHVIINVLPIYTNETLKSEKHQAKEEDLLKLQNTLEKKKKLKIVKKQRTKEIKEKLWLPVRIP